MDISNLSHLITRILAKGLTQSEIGAEIGCSQSTVSDLAAGKIGKSRPSYKIVEGIKRLAKEKGVLEDDANSS